MRDLYDIRPSQVIYGLLIGEYFCSLVPENNRVVWYVKYFLSDKVRETQAKKHKRTANTEVTYIGFEFTLEDIIKRGKWLLVQPSNKILKSDKLDILEQLIKKK